VVYQRDAGASLVRWRRSCRCGSDPGSLVGSAPAKSLATPTVPTPSCTGPSTLKYVGSLLTGGKFAIAVGYGAVWVASGIADSVTRLDPTTLAPMATIRLPVGSFPADIAAGEGAVWVVNRISRNSRPHRPGDEPGRQDYPRRRPSRGHRRRRGRSVGDHPVNRREVYNPGGRKREVGREGLEPWD
jgi:hypothetical protein